MTNLNKGEYRGLTPNQPTDRFACKLVVGYIHLICRQTGNAGANPGWSSPL